MVGRANNGTQILLCGLAMSGVSHDRCPSMGILPVSVNTSEGPLGRECSSHLTQPKSHMGHLMEPHIHLPINQSASNLPWT